MPPIYIVAAFILVTILTIQNIVLVITDPLGCDYASTTINSYVSYLIVLSTANIIFICCLALTYIILDYNSKGAKYQMVVYLVITYLIAIAWFILGDIILIKNSHHCSLNGSFHIIYAVIIWISPLLHVVVNNKPKNDIYTDLELDTEASL